MALTNRFFADAFRDMHRAFSLLDDPSFFNDARRSLASSNNSLGSLRYPATDICETAEGYELHAELPGYDKKDIHIDVSDDNTLTLSGSVQHYRNSSSEEGKEGARNDKANNNATKWWTNERVSGNFQRSFSFPAPINTSGIKASYENGVLKVCVPKAENGGKKRIEIN
ncbi:hypothetical protein RMATCC62417_14453 [Rhizopus microsporus]|nr:hypothetical protein RMATCC62417_14453 [Rhizopus microsporus]